MREFIDGSTAIVRGALDAGCDFFAGYPITPASPILMMMLRELPKVGGIGIQAEDEIASMGMCIGATLTGRRALTATSGPGISLYSEHVGLAIMGEVPLVIVDVQRLGPATGAATTTGQGDVQFVRWGTAGGYPIIALAPSSVAECYHLTIKAFALAERFRCPVFLMTDKELNLTMATVPSDAIEDGAGVDRPRREGIEQDDSIVPYRYEPTAEVVPLVHYGDGAPVRFTGSTHDENAFITKDPKTVERLNQHLAAKIEEHRDEIELVDLDPDPQGADTLVVSYGSTAGAVREAVRIARRKGRRLSALTIHSLWPVPETAIAQALEGTRRVVVAELNLGQYRREIERLAGDRDVRGVHRIDGELIAPTEILEAAA